MKGTNGRVYGGDPERIHVPDGERAAVGAMLAAFLDNHMRQFAENRTEAQRETQSLCPGCYQIVAFDMLLRLADDNGQSRSELARTMMQAFARLSENPDSPAIEEIEVMLDPPTCEV